jgi:hypothetical protein
LSHSNIDDGTGDDAISRHVNLRSSNWKSSCCDNGRYCDPRGEVSQYPSPETLSQLDENKEVWRDGCIGDDVRRVVSV